MHLTAVTFAPNPLMIAPFAMMLLCIAFAPFVFKHHWERFYHVVSVALGSISVFYYLLILKQGGRLLDVAHEYAGFMALIGSLFVVAGGIHIKVKSGAKPWMNCLYLLTGAVISNIIGTTGASMLLIRPWLRMNQPRATGFHTVFFIFIVSNIGGCLTPIGDPPLFLGYLKGVPFWWVLEHCWKAWLIGVFGLTTVFYLFDLKNYRLAQSVRSPGESGHGSWKITGWLNLVFLAVILGAIFVSRPAGLRELLMVAAAVASYFLTSRHVHEANQFTFKPVTEVAWLFLGIFATMVPALDYLEIHASSLGIHSGLQFYWLTGLLSALLDNAPTYLAFLATAFGANSLTLGNAAQMDLFIHSHARLLGAISVGSVFFGAMTYIGNGPNFMVKSISAESGVRTPEFLEYIYKYALPVLFPILFAIGILFFSNWRIF